MYFRYTLCMLFHRWGTGVCVRLCVFGWKLQLHAFGYGFPRRPAAARDSLPRLLVLRHVRLGVLNAFPPRQQPFIASIAIYIILAYYKIFSYAELPDNGYQFAE